MRFRLLIAAVATARQICLRPRSLRHRADAIQQCWIQIGRTRRWANAAGPLVAIILVGCDTPADPPGVASSKFDGTYVGAGQLEGNNPICPQSPPSPRMVIVNGRLEYRHGGAAAAAIFHVPIHDDGSFSGSTINQGNKQIQALEGKIVGNSIEADTESPWCQYHLTLKRE